MSAYPEHDKLEAVQEQSQAIGEFLDNSDYTLCELTRFDGYSDQVFVATRLSITQILADYFEIDLTEIETEKRAMLNAHRVASS